MQSAFAYQPLPPKSIRVIRLRPAHHPEDPLRCTINIVSLGRAATQSYEALSYVWGEPTRQWPLECDGKELLVTRSCHDALVHLRRRFTSRVLWIDAICINQGDDDEAVTERNGQVAMMGEIYLKAARVLVWLPPARESTPTLFRYLRTARFFNIIENDYPRLGDILYYVVTRHFDIRHGSLIKNRGPQLQECFAAILDNPWFERVWTMQEVAFARECVIYQGHSKLGWESFCAAYMTIPQLWNSSRPRRELVLPRWRLYLALRGNSLEAIPPARFEGDTQKEFELQLLGELRNLKATVPQDRVYSLYAVFQAMGLYMPAPDYKKDIFTVFEEATIAYIRGRQNLDIIAATPPPAEGSGFPSWVPDWLTPGSNSDMLIWKIAQFEAKRPTITLSLTENTGNGKLGVMGRKIGRITKRIRCPLLGDSALARDQAYQEFISACFDWRRLLDSLVAYPSGKDPKDLERTLLRPYHHAVANGALELWWRWFLQGCGTPPPKDDPTLDVMMEKRKRAGKWLVFCLDSGYYGTTHHLCQVGDEVSLLGSLNPLVLRRQKEARQFRIVTPAYCEGAMNGDVQSRAEELEEIILV
ncbi:hypothetical protein MFIFM68171_04688 [Madurella fahalii]|uniref:Heterokaryon incompatibility domain-containing protein n=1 Tax=Madurella fahalii TaxID=1157608 RepID=A0ABQ0G9M8_9PEZI